MNLPLIPADKANHALYGLAIYLVAALAALLLGLPHARVIGLAAALGFGVLKELADAVMNWRASGDWRVGQHGVEPLDALATAMGGAAGYGAGLLA